MCAKMTIDRAVDEIACILTGNEAYVAKYRDTDEVATEMAPPRKRKRVRTCSGAAMGPVEFEIGEAVREEAPPVNVVECEAIEDPAPVERPARPESPKTAGKKPETRKRRTPVPDPSRKGVGGRPKMVDVSPPREKPACKRTWKQIKGTWNCRNCGPLPVSRFYKKGDLCKECKKKENLIRYRGHA